METIDTASDPADKIAGAAKKALAGKGEQLSDAERQMIDNCRDYIHDNPIRSMGIAIAAVFFLSRAQANR